MPPPDPAIARAIEAVEGPLGAYAAKELDNQPEHRIRPADHAKALMGAAPELAQLLDDGELIAIAEESERHAQLAAEYQARFRKKWAAAAITAFVFTVSSGAVLAVNAAFDAESKLRQPLAVACSIVALLAAAVGVWLITNLRGTGLFSLWNKARARAEDGKAQLAMRVASLAPPDEGAGVFVRLCQFEYLRHIVLESQLRYYADSAKKHRRKADQLTGLESTAAAASAIAAAGLGVGLLSGVGWAAWLPMCGVFTGALTTLAASFDQLYQHRQLASLYEDAHRALSRVKGQVGAARAAIAAGNTEALPMFIKAVLEPMQAEHRQWLERGAGADNVLERLEKVLHPRKDDEKPPPGGG